MRDLRNEIDRLALGNRARTHTLNDVVISTNVSLRKSDGMPFANEMQKWLPDPGVAIYFERKDKPICMACDTYDRVWKNMRALALSLEALRGLERWGSSQILDRAFDGFAALPEKSACVTCWDILGIGPTNLQADISAAFRKQAFQHHPDRGGTNEMMAKINDAYEQAMATI